MNVGCELWNGSGGADGGCVSVLVAFVIGSAFVAGVRYEACGAAINLVASQCIVR